MNSREIFRLYKSKYYLTNWFNETGELAHSEGDVKWLYCGIGNDFKKEIVDRTINDTFTDEEVYLCISSNHSSLVLKSIVTNEIAKYLHKSEIGIINKSFTRIVFFNQYGTFKSGIIREYPQCRPRPIGKPLKVSFHANKMDQNTEKISQIIRNHFSNLEKELYNDYGGDVEYLWIDVELVENDLKNRKSWPFRFQKRVSIPSSYTELYSYNVVHYSIEPDFEKLKELLYEDEICKYIFRLLYESTQILVNKQSKLGGFDVIKFRLDFLTAYDKLISSFTY